MEKTHFWFAPPKQAVKTVKFFLSLPTSSNIYQNISTPQKCTRSPDCLDFFPTKRVYFNVHKNGIFIIKSVIKMSKIALPFFPLKEAEKCWDHLDMSKISNQYDYSAEGVSSKQ